jgi:hypothetical protein
MWGALQSRKYFLHRPGELLPNKAADSLTSKVENWERGNASAVHEFPPVTLREMSVRNE